MSDVSASRRCADSTPHTPRLTLLIASALAFFTLSATANDRPLGLDETRRLAVERSPAMTAITANAQAQREMAVAAGQRPDPVLRLGAANVPIESAERYSLDRDFMTMTNIAVMQELPSQAKREARHAKSMREAEVADAMRTAQAAQIERDAALAWLERSFQQRVRIVLVRQLEEAQLLLTGVETAFRAGRGPQADIFNARAAIAQIQDRIDSVDVLIASATTRLTRWIGDDAARPPDTLPDIDRLPFTDSDVAQYLEQHPTLEVARRQETLADAEVHLAERARDRDISVELMYSRRGKAFTDMVSVNVAFPLLWNPGKRQDRELAARLALRDAARAQVEEQRRAQLAETRALLREWATLRDRLRRYDSALSPLARQRSDAALTAYRAGTGILIVALDARRAVLDTELEYLRLELDAARVWVQLATLRGRYDPQSRAADRSISVSSGETRP